MERIEVDCGYCQCGCGRKTETIKANDRRYGRVKGQPSAYCFGHNHKTVHSFILENRGYESPCWIWQRHINRGGYALMSHWLGDRCNPNRYAHRYYYEFLIGPIPDELDIHHLCKVRCCVNPNHLEPITRLEHSHTKSNYITEEKAQEILELRRSKMPMKDIATRYGVTVGCIEVVCHKGGVRLTTTHTKARIEEMLSLRRNGMLLKDIAAQFGITPKAAGSICHRAKVWVRK